MKSNYQEYLKDKAWSDLKIQPIAIEKIYSKLWPGSEIIELDQGAPGSLHTILDIAGADKLIRYQDGTVSFLAQRFRRAEQSSYDDFTMRFHRNGGNKTEYEKVIESIQNKTLVAGFYAYGLVNTKEDGFTRFRVLDYPLFLQDYLSGKIPEPGIKPNKDKRTSFAYWPFLELKDYLTFYFGEFQNKHNPPGIKYLNSKELAVHERNSIIRKISQSHLNPRMSLAKLNEIFDRYNIGSTGDWDKFSIEQLQNILLEINQDGDQ